MKLSGAFRILVLYDVAEAIRLDVLRRIMGQEPPARLPAFVHRTPEYVRFERPPVVEAAGAIQIETGERFEATLKYYDYGVVSIELELQFAGEWDFLVNQASRWLDAPGLEARALQLIRQRLEGAGEALLRPYTDWLSEDYCIIYLREALRDDGRPFSAPELLSQYGAVIAQIVRGETLPLSDLERQEILQSSISYYPSDLLVVGWTAALVYDSLEGASATLQLLEYANTQLLEFRHYDNLLTRVLEKVYGKLEEGSGFLGPWRLGREAGRLNTIRLDVIELSERTDNAIKFLSDMFFARLYRLAAAKVGVADYKNLVDQKLRTAGELYQFMVEQFHQGRAFVLELAVVIILIIDLVFLFRGHSLY